jgi:protein-S-isoprenylcysteine O-methyltransferase Ste14
MLFSIVLFLICLFTGVCFYIKSVSPSIAKNKSDSNIYTRCRIYRQLASFFLNINFLGYILISKLEFTPHLDRFQWNYGITVIFALAVAVPGLYLFVKGRKDLGYESIAPALSNPLVFEGIYKNIRHPQAAGEISLWFAWSFLLNSPLLILISVVWIPVYYLMCLAEERDLLIRFGEAYSEYINCSGFFLPNGYRFTRLNIKA